MKNDSFIELIKSSPNVPTLDGFAKCKSIINYHDKIMVSISGGKDSDTMLDLILKVIRSNDIDINKFHFVFFDTGIEYQATKDHLKYLEDKYNITIERHKAVIPVPTGCRKYGLPFISKQVSENISRLQKHNFDFTNDGNKDYDELIKKYPKCLSALKWWCNCHDKKRNGSESSFNINYNKYLKEFMIDNPPEFKISQKCCWGAKKINAHKILKQLNADLNIVGIRKAEGGARSNAYKNCFSNNKMKKDYDDYRPIFWFSDKDEKEYIDFYKIKNSNCYLKYGLKRTGCAGCPFGNDFEYELENAKQYEPKLYNAINNIFQESYKYTRAYLEYKNKKNEIKRNEVI